MNVTKKPLKIERHEPTGAVSTALDGASILSWNGDAFDLNGSHGKGDEPF